MNEYIDTWVPIGLKILGIAVAIMAVVVLAWLTGPLPDRFSSVARVRTWVANALRGTSPKEW